MTSTRLARGTKGRVLLYLCAIIIVTGIIALYHTTQTQLEDVRKSNDLCHQQQESLSTQLQVIFEYKQRLEKSLQSEKAEHKQTKSELEAKINDEKSRRNKTSMEATLRFASLQQHYKLLQSQHEDFKEECSKIQQQQLTEINNLQSKYKELQEQLKKSLSDKDNSIEHLKTQYIQIQQTKDELEKQIRENRGNIANSENEVHRLRMENHRLKRELEVVKEQCHNSPFGQKHVSPSQAIKPTPVKAASSTAHFSRQVEMDDFQYQIRDEQNQPFQRPVVAAPPPPPPPSHQDNQLNNPNEMPDNNAPPESQQMFKNSENNVLAMPPNAVAAPENANPNPNRNNFLPAPNMEKPKGITPKTTTKAGFKVSKASLDGAKPLLQPSVTTSSSTRSKFSSSKSLIQPRAAGNDDSKNVLPAPNLNAGNKKKLPEGVVPPGVVPQMRGNAEEAKVDKPDDRNIPDEINDALPNRYRNNIIDSEMQHANKQAKEAAAAVAESPQSQLFHLNMDLNQENSAAEVLDPAKGPDQFNMMDTNNNLEAIENNLIGNSNVNNNNKPLGKPMIHHVAMDGPRKFRKQHIDDLKMGEAKLNGGEALGGAGYNDEPDYDKDGQRGDEMQLEEIEAEGGEDDDPDDYEGHLAARQKEPAVRH